MIKSYVKNFCFQDFLHIKLQLDKEVYDDLSDKMFQKVNNLYYINTTLFTITKNFNIHLTVHQNLKNEA